jgi:hypothetical protein
MPELDAGRIARLRDVLAGGHLGLDPDRRLAASLTARWPWLPDAVQGANEFHRRAAHWAVTGGTPECPVPPAAGVIFAASGYPVGGKDAAGGPLPLGFHGAAQAARPDALFAYADVDIAALTYNLALLAEPDPGRVSAYLASARNPEELLSNGHAQAIASRGPVLVQLQLCLHWWPADFAAHALAGYGEQLPPGSAVALSAGVPGGGPGWQELTADLLAAGTVYSHTGDDIAGWLKAAGLQLTPAGITDVRAQGGWAAAEFGRQKPVARVIEAVALKP